MSQQKKLFLIGPGFIGGTVLLRLKETRPDLKLSALTRRDEQAKELSDLGIEPIKGSLDDADIISKYAAEADIVFHTATADHEASALAVVEGIKKRSNKDKKVIYIHTSGADEMLFTAKEMANESWQKKSLSDVKGDGHVEERLTPDSAHRQVDLPLRQKLFNEEDEKSNNVSAAIMVPPLIYGIGCKPWERISIQTPMLAKAMMDHGTFALPKDSPALGSAVSVHDLAEAYLVLLSDLEKHIPGSPQPAHYVFVSEKEPFSWREHLEAVASVLKRVGHPSAKQEPRVIDEQQFYEVIGGKDNPYASYFQGHLFSRENSFTIADRLHQLGFRHKAKGVIESILNGKELDRFIQDTKSK